MRRQFITLLAVLLTLLLTLVPATESAVMAQTAAQSRPEPKVFVTTKPRRR